MISTNFVTFEVSFVNSTETLIVNNRLENLQPFIEYIKNFSLKIDKIKEFERSQSKFKKCNLYRFITVTDHCTELNIFLTSKK